MLDESLKTDKSPDLKTFDSAVKNWEWKWVNKHDNTYSSQPRGNAYEVATRLYKKYYQKILKTT